MGLRMAGQERQRNERHCAMWRRVCKLKEGSSSESAGGVGTKERGETPTPWEAAQKVTKGDLTHGHQIIVDPVLRGMERRGSREWRPKWARGEKRPAGGGPLVVPTTSSLALSLITCYVMCCSFLIANTTARSDYVESLHSAHSFRKGPTQ